MKIKVTYNLIKNTGKIYGVHQEDHQGRSNTRRYNLHYSTMDLFKIIISKTLELDKTRNNACQLWNEKEKLRKIMNVASKIVPLSEIGLKIVINKYEELLYIFNIEKSYVKENIAECKTLMREENQKMKY